MTLTRQKSSVWIVGLAALCTIAACSVTMPPNGDATTGGSGLDNDWNEDGGVEIMSGCWRVSFENATSDNPMFDDSPFDQDVIYQFDSLGRLERLWGVYGEPTAEGIELTELIRFTSPNAGPMAEILIDVGQNVSAGEDDAQVTIRWGFDALVVLECEELGTGSSRFEIQDAVLLGNPPTGFGDASFEQVSETTATGPFGTPMTITQTVTGTASATLVSCPDTASPEVESQEEHPFVPCDGDDDGM